MQNVFLISAQCLSMLYICTKIRENISKGFKVLSGHDLHIITYKGVKFHKNACGELRYLFPAHCLMMFYICARFRENILEAFSVNER